MSVWLPSAPCTPGACLERTGPVTALPRAAGRLLAVTALLLAGIALLPAGRLIPAGAVRWWCRAVVRASGVRVRVSGAAVPTGGVLLVANHISWLDIPLLAAVRPARMLAKSEIRRWPVAGWLTARSGALFIERDRLRALPDTVAGIAGALRGGAAVAVFPEGSTWCGRAQGHFRRAVFQAALDAGVPVQPVRLRYRVSGGEASTAPAFIGDDSLLTSVWRVVSARGLVAEVGVPEPVAPGCHTDRRTLAATAQAQVWGEHTAERHPVEPCGENGPLPAQAARDVVRPRRPRRRLPLLATQPPGVSARAR
ncbi:lysophospholipid acyltransferase family protein [Streptomyces sp. 351MFTsu5.1]|uniref:lysophospholipid acyltransferase family protein n=1 Tax=Streptomyces sp. 351MFTsu5.1 TaxID=1172180 RepID=UPI00036EE078|nr:lysophospholipid acyltransferase family protein [Streptomyces sp. 351MFTsu5.1]